MSKSARSEWLILVHPGSLCGSADFNLGKVQANAARAAVVRELSAWQCNVLVLDGDLSDEMPRYLTLDVAIETLKVRTLRAGRKFMRVDAPDPEHGQIALEVLKRELVDLDSEIAVTGAWYMPDDSYGCVNSTRSELAAAGFASVRILSSAAIAEEDAPTNDSEISCERLQLLCRQAIAPDSTASQEAQNSRTHRHKP